MGEQRRTVQMFNTNEYGQATVRIISHAIRRELNRLETLADHAPAGERKERLLDDIERLRDPLWDLEHRRAGQVVVLGELA